MWQALHQELSDRNFVVIAVAMDSRGESAVTKLIQKARTTHPSLIDRDHVVADLYNMTNVPQAVWIDEAGKIVRPTEVSGFSMTLNLMKVRRTRNYYLDAIRDWVAKGAESEFVFDEAEARAHVPEFTPEIALAHANFHLGQHLFNAGKKEEARTFLERAVELNPDSWNFWRQMKNLDNVLGSGGPAFFRRARQYSKSGKQYYPLPDLKGIEKVAG